MRSPLRFAAPIWVPVLLSLLSGCGAHTSVGASPSLAGNWNFQSASVSSAPGQIAHLGGALLVTSGGTITGILRTLPSSGQDASSLCYSTANPISVTGSVSADKTLVLTSSDFGGNVLTVRGTYVAGEGKTSPSLSNATMSITGPCGVAVQTVAATQYPLLDGTYSGTATFGANSVPFSVTFSNASTPVTVSGDPSVPSQPNFGQYAVTSTATFGQNVCFSSSSVKQTETNTLNGYFGLGFYGNLFSAFYTDPITFTMVSVNASSTDPQSDGLYFDITMSTHSTYYAQCSDTGTAILYKQQ